jgi:cytochrome o ubiquinol oxidase operon protein cyoD
MSASQNQHEVHDHDEENDEFQVNIRDYLIGFLLAVFLTVIPFTLVMGNVIQDSVTTAMVILSLGAVQMVVHMVYFLHMNSKSQGGWIMLAFVFTLIIVVITLVGSIWVMHHLNSNMMPSMNHEVIESIQQLK